MLHSKPTALTLTQEHWTQKMMDATGTTKRGSAMLKADGTIQTSFLQRCAASVVAATWTLELVTCVPMSVVRPQLFQAIKLLCQLQTIH